MQRIALQIVIFSVVIILSKLFSSLASPFNLIDPVTISIMIWFLLSEIETALVPTLLFGIFKDYFISIPVGLSSLIYSVELLFIILIRNTVISHKNISSYFLFTFIFNIIYFFALFIVKMRFSIVILGETVLIVIINALLTFSIFMLIQWCGVQLKKYFL